MLEKITKTAMQFNEMGITEFSIKCNKVHLDLLKWEITEKFSRYSLEIPDLTKKVELHIFGVKFKASLGKSRLYPSRE